MMTVNYKITDDLLGIVDISNASFVKDMFASSGRFDSNWVWVFSPPTLSSLYSTELKI